MAIVVSDTSPLRCLAHLNLLPALQTLYGQVLLPPAVAQELLIPSLVAGHLDVVQWPFLVVRPAANLSKIQQFQQQLDLGESEALTLALEVQADHVLIDEKLGRAVAIQHGLKPLGTLGVLVRAKQHGLTALVGPLIIRLRDELGFFISARLEAATLRRVGE